MKFTIDSSHRDYFRQHLAIEFDDLLPVTALKELKKGISKALSERIGLSLDEVFSAPPEKLFMAGRDLWRAEEDVHKIVTKKRWAEFASQLTEQTFLRLGFDEFFPDASKAHFSSKTDPYQKLLKEKLTLSEICSLQGVVCGLMLCLEGGEGSSQEQLSPFTRIPGNGVYLAPDCVIDFKELYEREGHQYLLIVYGRSSTVYIHQNKDPHAHALKQLGYSLGDKLKDKLNPVIIR